MNYNLILIWTTIIFNVFFILKICVVLKDIDEWKKFVNQRLDEIQKEIYELKRKELR